MKLIQKLTSLRGDGVDIAVWSDGQADKDKTATVTVR